MIWWTKTWFKQEISFMWPEYLPNKQHNNNENTKVFLIIIEIREYFLLKQNQPSNLESFCVENRKTLYTTKIKF